MKKNRSVFFCFLCVLGIVNFSACTALTTKIGDQLFCPYGDCNDAVGEVSPPMVSSLDNDMRKAGWKLLEDSPRRINSISGAHLTQALRRDEQNITGEEMVRRARTELDANFGQADAEWLLQHKSEIPAEWKNFYIDFPGTIWIDSYGYRSIPCITWNGGDWILRFHWLDYDGFSHGRLLNLHTTN